MNFSRNRSDRRQNLFVKVVLVAVFVFMLFIAGALTALLPQFVARLLPIPIIFIMGMLAVFNQTDKPLADSALKLWIAILLGTMVLWPTYLIFKIGSLPSIDARRIVAGLSFVAIFFFAISRKPILRALFQENVGPLRIGSLLITSYVMWRIVSCFASPNPVFSLIQIFWEVLYYYSMFFIGALFFDRRSLHDWGMTIFMLLAVLVSCYAGVEWLLQKNILLKLIPVNESFSDMQVALTTSRMRDGFFRSQSTFEHPLLLAEFSSIAACFGLAALLWPHKKFAFRVLGGITLICAMFASLLTGSRSGFVTFLVGGGLVFLLWLFSLKINVQGSKKQPFRKISFILTLITAVTIAIPTVTLIAKGKTRLESSSTEARVLMYEMGLPSIKENPLLGTGLGTAGEIAGLRTSIGLTTLDNYFLAIAIESGMPAFLLLLASLLYPVWVIFNRLMSRTRNSDQLFAAVAGSLVVITISRTILWMPNNFVFAFLFAGIVLSSASKNLPEEKVVTE